MSNVIDAIKAKANELKAAREKFDNADDCDWDCVGEEFEDLAITSAPFLCDALLCLIEQNRLMREALPIVRTGYGSTYIQNTVLVEQVMNEVARLDAELEERLK